MVAEWFRQLYERTGVNLTIFYDRVDGLTYLNGLATTAKLSAACLVVSVAVGIAGAWLQRSAFAPLRWLVNGYVAFFRNTPPLAQLYFFYFGVGSIMPLIPDGAGGTHRLFDNFQWAVISMSLFAGAFNVEIFRAGIEAVPKATTDAAEALGYSRSSPTSTSCCRSRSASAFRRSTITSSPWSRARPSPTRSACPSC